MQRSVYFPSKEPCGCPSSIYETTICFYADMRKAMSYMKFWAVCDFYSAFLTWMVPILGPPANPNPLHDLTFSVMKPPSRHLLKPEPWHHPLLSLPSHSHQPPDNTHKWHCRVCPGPPNLTTSQPSSAIPPPRPDHRSHNLTWMSQYPPSLASALSSSQSSPRPLPPPLPTLNWKECSFKHTHQLLQPCFKSFSGFPGHLE